ncbi:MAG: efflux transporter outer membrane subunit [Wolinella sp.]
MKPNVAIVLASALLVAGCSMTPKLEIPESELPSQYGKESKSQMNISLEWWEGFDDPILSGLIREALEKNHDLRQAAVNVALARASLSSAESELYPSLSAESSAARRKSSKESYPVGGGSIQNSFSLSGILSYELDLFGRLRDAKSAAQSQLLASEANRATIQLSIVSSVADGYFNLITLREQIGILKETLDAYSATYDYRSIQYRAGTVSEIVMEQSRAEMESARASLYSYERQVSELESALSLLLGRTPKEIFEKEIESASVLGEMPVVPAGLPSELLNHRSDIKSAEERLRAANFSIGVARASYFPKISLSGALGFQSMELNKLMRSSGEFWSIGGNLATPILDFGRISAQVESAEAQKEAAKISYEATVARAFSEVRDSLVKRESAIKRLDALNAQLKAQNRVLEIAEKRFENGYVSHLELLDAKRQHLASRLALSGAKLESASAVVTIYKALGGGFIAN